MSEVKSMHYDVIIVGAGMVGATLGCALGQQGMRILLLDHSAPERYDSAQAPDLRVSALNLASRNIMRRLGVWTSIEEKRVCPFLKMQVWEELPQGLPLLDLLPFPSSSEKRINQTTFDCAHIQQPALGYILENRVLQLSLHESLKTLNSVTLATGVTVKEFLSGPAASEKKLLLSNDKTCTTPLVVGADGARSNIRQWVGFGVDRKEYGQQALVATVELADGPLDSTWQAFVSTGPMALLPLPDCAGKHYASLVWYHQPDDVKRLMALSDPAFLSELIDCFPEELPDTTRLHQRGWFPLAKQHAQQYVCEGVALVGDAAHTVNPLAGQGVNLGLMDVAELADVVTDAWKQNKHYGAVDNLMIYQQHRKADNRNMAWILDAFYHGFSNDKLPLKLARNAGLALMGKLGPVSKYIEEYGAGLRGRLPSLAKKVD